MKFANRAITIAITCIAAPLMSALILSMMLGGVSGELILPVFLISFPFVLILGTPFSLAINHWLKSKGPGWFFTKLLLHAAGGFIIIFVWILAAGGWKDAFSAESPLFYLAAVLNAILYFVVFSLLKLTGKTDLD